MTNSSTNPYFWFTYEKPNGYQYRSSILSLELFSNGELKIHNGVLEREFIPESGDKYFDGQYHTFDQQRWFNY